MATLKDHQAAMVELLAHGTAIPASATRLAHALHDVLAALNDKPIAAEAHTERRSEATTSGLNDVALAQDIVAVTPKQHYGSLLKQRDNTIRQLKARVADLVIERDEVRNDMQLSLAKIREASNPEQAGCELPTLGSDSVNEASWLLHDLLVSHGPLSGHQFNNIKGCFYAALQVALGNKEQEQSGVRKEDTQL